MYLITGGAGFIGSNVVAALSATGAAVAICDRLRDGAKWRNLAKAEIHDIVAPEVLPDWLEKHGSQVASVIHLGAVSSTTEINVDLIVESNYRLSCYLWQWCTTHEKRLIYASSAATYGSGEHGFDDDPAAAAMARLRPLNAYGWSKHMFDRWALRHVSSGGPVPAQWVGLKFFNVYGPNEYHKGSMRSVAVKMYEQLMEGRPITLFRSHRPGVSDGGQQRDFVLVDDCVKIILWLTEQPQINGVFNVGTGQARSFAELAQAMLQVTDTQRPIEFVDMPAAIRSNYQYFTQASIERLREAGYRESFATLEEGIAQYVTRYLSASDRYR